MSSRPAGNAAFVFIFIAVLVDSIGFGIILPVLPRLIMQLTGVTVDRAAAYGGWLVVRVRADAVLLRAGTRQPERSLRPPAGTPVRAGGARVRLPDHGLGAGDRLAVRGRAIAGVAGASFTPAYAYVADISAPEKRAQHFGLMGAAFGIGFILGPAIGGLLGGFGPRAPFFTAGAIALANTTLGFIVLPESLPQASRRPFQWARANPLGTVLQILKYPSVTWLLAALLLWQIAHQVLPSTWAFYTIFKFHWSSAQVGYSLAFVGVVMAFAQGVLTRVLIPWLGGERRAAAAGMAAALVAYVGYAFAAAGWVMYLVSLSTLLFALTYPSMNAIASRQIPANAQGELQGAVASLYSLSAIVGPPLMTQVFGAFSHAGAGVYFPGAAFLTAALLTIGCAALFAQALRLAPRPAAAQLPQITPGD